MYVDAGAFALPLPKSGLAVRVRDGGDVVRHLTVGFRQGGSQADPKNRGLLRTMIQRRKGGVATLFQRRKGGVMGGCRFEGTHHRVVGGVHDRREDGGKLHAENHFLHRVVINRVCWGRKLASPRLGMHRGNGGVDIIIRRVRVMVRPVLPSKHREEGLAHGRWSMDGKADRVLVPLEGRGGGQVDRFGM